jgi:acetyl-CoA carboxylase biotin carboxyl carrier protein
VDDKELRELMDYIAASNFGEFELTREGFRLRLVKASPAGASVDGVPPAALVPRPSPSLTSQGVAAEPASSAATTAPEPGLEVIHSPMVGTFFRAPNPNADPFVEAGDRVDPGQVICIIEAMKLMNEIEADRAGEIVDILVANGQPVEFGEALFRIRPQV